MVQKLIQPDARGRIQLPKPYRYESLFEIEERGQSLILHPVEFKKKRQKRWLHEEVFDFYKKRMEPKVARWMKEHSLLAVALYGSRARGDAKQNSDFDFAAITPHKISRKERSALEDGMAGELKDVQQELSLHGVSADISLVLLPETIEDKVQPSLFYAIEEEGISLSACQPQWEKWTSKIQKNKKTYKVESEGKGKTKKWRWKSQK